MIRLRHRWVASAVPLVGAAVALALAPSTAASGRWTVLGAQTPRVAPPPPCRAGPADTALLAAVQRASRRGATNIAVLEFDSQVMDASRVHLAPAITARVRSRLASLDGVYVESRGTVERVSSALAGGVDSLLSSLGDQFAIVGDVIPQRDRIDVTVRIVQPGVADARWERVFAYPRASVREVEDAVAEAVAELAGSRASTSRSSMTDAAYELVLRGDYFLAAHDAVSADSARRNYERAAEDDVAAAIPPARAARARAAFLERSDRLDQRLIGEYVLAGMARVERALRADSTLAEAWTARAILLRYRNPASYAGAVSAHERAVALAPGSADARDAYGVTLMRLGRAAAAEQQFRRALALEPNRASTLRSLAELEYMRSRFRASCALVNASIGADSYDPLAYALRARVRMRLGEFRDAFSDAETAHRLVDSGWGEALQLLVTANASSVDDARLEARRIAAAKLRPGTTMSVQEGAYLSMALDALGDRDKAFDALGRVQPVGAEFVTALRDPGFNGMRSDPRFRTLASRSSGASRQPAGPPRGRGVAARLSAAARP